VEDTADEDRDSGEFDIAFIVFMVLSVSVEKEDSNALDESDSKSLVYSGLGKSCGAMLQQPSNKDVEGPDSFQVERSASIQCIRVEDSQQQNVNITQIFGGVTNGGIYVR
jgi:hypothetical protein